MDKMKRNDTKSEDVNASTDLKDDGVSAFLDKDRYFASLDERHSRWMQSRRRQKDRIDNYRTKHFGVCPGCHTFDWIETIGKNNWVVCHEHRCRWLLGSGLVSHLPWESKLDLEWNYQLTKDYAEVEPISISSPPPKRRVAVVCLDSVFDYLLRAVQRLELKLKKMKCWINGELYLSDEGDLQQCPL